MSSVDYLESNKETLFKLFQDGLIGPADFKIQDRFVLRQVARKLVVRLVRGELNLHNLWSNESDLLKHIAKNLCDFLNHDTPSTDQGWAVIRWFEKVWQAWCHENKGPPGGLALEEKTPETEYEYFRIRLVHVKPHFCCFGTPKLRGIQFMFRSDLLGYDLYEMMQEANAFGVGSSRYQVQLYYDGLPVEMKTRIPALMDGGVIDVYLSKF